MTDRPNVDEKYCFLLRFQKRKSLYGYRRRWPGFEHGNQNRSGPRSVVGAGTPGMPLPALSSDPETPGVLMSQSKQVRSTKRKYVFRKLPYPEPHFARFRTKWNLAPIRLHENYPDFLLVKSGSLHHRNPHGVKRPNTDAAHHKSWDMRYSSLSRTICATTSSNVQQWANAEQSDQRKNMCRDRRDLSVDAIETGDGFRQHRWGDCRLDMRRNWEVWKPAPPHYPWSPSAW